MGKSVKKSLVDHDGRRALPRPDLAPMGRMPAVIRVEGACIDAEAGLFDVDDSLSDPHRAARARAVCAECPVAQICRDYALANEPYGFWGGLDAFERLELRGRPLPDVAERDAAARIRALTEQGWSAEQIAAEFDVAPRSIERWRDSAGLVQHRGDSDDAGASPEPAASAEALDRGAAEFALV